MCQPPGIEDHRRFKCDLIFVPQPRSAHPERQHAQPARDPRSLPRGMSCPVGRTTNSFAQIPSGRLMMKAMHSASDSGDAGPAPSANIGGFRNGDLPVDDDSLPAQPLGLEHARHDETDIDGVLRQLEAKAVNAASSPRLAAASMPALGIGVSAPVEPTMTTSRRPDRGNRAVA